MIRSLFLIVTTIILCSFVQDTHRMSIHMESQRIANGKLIKIIADIYFKYNEGELTMHYTYPNDYLLMTNLKGEVKVYYPSKNEVTISQNRIFSSENEVLYMFLTNRYNDMGLKEAGFSLSNSKLKDKMQITTWMPPAHKIGELSKIELVHENYLPIYTAYYNSKSQVFKKVYYSNYNLASFTPIPQKITEIDFTPKGDSIINRKVYSNLKIGNQCDNKIFNFTIPQNAKIIKGK